MVLEAFADPMTLLEICWFSSTARSSSLHEVSYPVTKQSSAGVLLTISAVRSSADDRRDPDAGFADAGWPTLEVAFVRDSLLRTSHE